MSSARVVSALLALSATAQAAIPSSPLCTSCMPLSPVINKADLSMPNEAAGWLAAGIMMGGVFLFGAKQLLDEGIRRFRRYQIHRHNSRELNPDLDFKAEILPTNTVNVYKVNSTTGQRKRERQVIPRFPDIRTDYSNSDRYNGHAKELYRSNRKKAHREEKRREQEKNSFHRVHRG